jgi:AbrB family looped-hinge helix DNA binding protein
MWLTMEPVTVSKKYQVVIPEKIRKKAGIKPGDKMVAITKHGIIQYIPVYPIKETKGFIKNLNTEELRDESERID